MFQSARTGQGAYHKRRKPAPDWEATIHENMTKKTVQTSAMPGIPLTPRLLATVPRSLCHADRRREVRGVGGEILHGHHPSELVQHIHDRLPSTALVEGRAAPLSDLPEGLGEGLELAPGF